MSKKVTGTQKLNAHQCKEQPEKISFIPCTISACAPFVALHTSDDIRLRAKHFAVIGRSVFAVAVSIRFFKLFIITGTGGTQTSSFTKPNRKSRGGSYVEIAEARKWAPVGRSIVQTTACSRMLSPHCGCMVALRHFEKHLVCLEVAGALTMAPT
jgi:hypothetical protein